MHGFVGAVAYYRLEGDKINIYSVIKGNPLLHSLDCARLVKPSQSRFFGKRSAAAISFIEAVVEEDALIIGQADGELWLWSWWQDDLEHLCTAGTPLIWAHSWQGKLITLNKSGRLLWTDTAYDLLDTSVEKQAMKVAWCQVETSLHILAVASDTHLTLWQIRPDQPPSELLQMRLPEPIKAVQMARESHLIPMALVFSSHLEWLVYDLESEGLLRNPLSLNGSYQAVCVCAGKFTGPNS